MRVSVDKDNILFFKALASKTRMKIINILSDKAMNISQIASKLGLSSTITARHVDMLEKSNIIATESIPGKRGIQKLCSLNLKSASLVFPSKIQKSKKFKSMSIPIGSYINYNVSPSCGLIGVDEFIGMNDDSRYFSSPQKSNAGLIWYASGFLTYAIPSYFIDTSGLNSMEISLEICSEYPGYNENWLSDIYFYINKEKLGYWTSPGDFGEKRGILTPNWWNDTQYGMLKTIKIDSTGTYIDGKQISDTTLQSLNLADNTDVYFKIESPYYAKNSGGVSLFGKDFGNYAQDINIKLIY